MRALPSNTLLRHLTFAALAAIVLGLLTSVLPAFTDYKIAAIAYTAIAAVGLTLLTGLNGQLSLGHGGLMAIGAYTTSLILKHDPSFTVAGVMIASLIVTSLAGALVGVAAARLRGPYLAGATLALAVGIPPIAVRFHDFFGGEQGISVPPLSVPSGLGSGFPAERWLVWVALAAALSVMVLVANLTRSRFGRAFRAVRDDEIASALAGIHVARTQILAFLISAACAGVAGSLYAFWVGLTAPAGFTLVLSLQLLTAVVLGGLGTLSGAIWGSALLIFVPGWTNSLASRLHLSTAVGDNIPLALYGGVLIVAMLAFPQGIQGGVRLAGRGFRSRIARRRGPPGRSPAQAETGPQE